MSQAKGMDGVLKTVRIMAPMSEGNPLGYVVINASDFDAKLHELYEEPKASKDGGKEAGSAKKAGKDGGKE